jgi:hypothetical protein
MRLVMDRAQPPGGFEQAVVALAAPAATLFGFEESSSLF